MLRLARFAPKNYRLLSTSLSRQAKPALDDLASLKNYEAKLQQYNESLAAKSSMTQSTELDTSGLVNSIAESDISSSVIQSPFNPISGFYDLCLSQDVSLWLAIPALTVCIRSIIFPTTDKMLKSSMDSPKTLTTKLELIQAYEARQNAKTDQEYHERNVDVNYLINKNNFSKLLSSFKIFLPLFLHSANFFTLRAMAASNLLPVASSSLPWTAYLKSAGLVAGTGLAVSDPILPALTIFLMYFNIMRGADDLSKLVEDLQSQGYQPEQLKKVAYVLAGGFGLFMAYMPATVSYMMFTNAVFNFLVISRIRSQDFYKQRFLPIPANVEIDQRANQITLKTLKQNSAMHEDVTKLEKLQAEKEQLEKLRDLQKIKQLEEMRQRRKKLEQKMKQKRE